MKKGRGCGWVMGMLVATPLMMALLYWSWCWGGWGRENRLMRYWFQCQCPLASAEARHPDNVDVLVSACDDPYYNGASVSPSGRYTVFIVRRPVSQTFLYDRRTDNFTPSNLGGGFLTDEIEFKVKHVSGDVYEFFLRDLTGKTLVQLNRISMSKNFSFDPVTLKAFREAEKVYVFSWVAVALAPNFQQHPEANFILDRGGVSDPNSYEKIVQLLQENGIKFETLSQGPNTILPIPTIYLFGGEPPSPGVWRVPQPLLRQRLSLEELDPAARPRVEAQRAQEIVDKRNANLVLLAGVGLLVGLLGLTAFGAFRSLLGQPRT